MVPISCYLHHHLLFSFKKNHNHPVVCEVVSHCGLGLVFKVMVKVSRMDMGHDLITSTDGLKLVFSGARFDQWVCLAWPLEGG
jgi:hypothetical protein